MYHSTLKIDYLSLAAVASLGQAVFEYFDNPLEILSHLSQLYEQDYEQDVLEALYGIIGTGYDELLTQLKNHDEARSQFIYGFIENMGEFIEELV
jgi:cobalamin biosynthesis Co2+ chelatase CbiK